MKLILSLALLACLIPGLAAQGPPPVFGNFECSSVGSFPSCEGWSSGTGVQSVQNNASVSVPSLPTAGNQFLEIAASGIPASPTYALGSGSPVWPLTAGNSHVFMDVVASGNTISVDYVWAAFAGALGGGSWMQILLVDPVTQAIITPVAVVDASTAPLMSFPHSPSFGSPTPTTTSLTTATAGVPAAYQGQLVRVVAMASETQNIFISPISFLYVDNFRFTTSVSVPYPGNGSDCAVEVEKNGVLSPGGVHALSLGDNFLLRSISPGGTLDNAGMALVYTMHNTSTPQMGTPITGMGPPDVWVSPSNVNVVYNSTQSGAFFLVPFLFPGGYAIGPYAVPPGLSGTSFNLQLIVNDPLYPFGFGLSDGDELMFL